MTYDKLPLWKRILLIPLITATAITFCLAGAVASIIVIPVLCIWKPKLIYVRADTSPPTFNQGDFE